MKTNTKHKMKLQQEKYCFTTTRTKWRKEWNEQTEIKDWFEFLENKLNNYEEDTAHYAAK